MVLWELIGQECFMTLFIYYICQVVELYSIPPLWCCLFCIHQFSNYFTLVGSLFHKGNYWSRKTALVYVCKALQNLGLTLYCMWNTVTENLHGWTTSISPTWTLMRVSGLLLSYIASCSDWWLNYALLHAPACLLLLGLVHPAAGESRESSWNDSQLTTWGHLEAKAWIIQRGAVLQVKIDTHFTEFTELKKTWAELIFMYRAHVAWTWKCLVVEKLFLRQTAGSVTENTFCIHSEIHVEAQELLKTVLSLLLNIHQLLTAEIWEEFTYCPVQQIHFLFSFYSF